MVTGPVILSLESTHGEDGVESTDSMKLHKTLNGFCPGGTGVCDIVCVPRRARVSSPVPHLQSRQIGHTWLHVWKRVPPDRPDVDIHPPALALTVGRGVGRARRITRLYVPA